MRYKVAPVFALGLAMAVSTATGCANIEPADPPRPVNMTIDASLVLIGDGSAARDGGSSDSASSDSAASVDAAISDANPLGDQRPSVDQSGAKQPADLAPAVDMTPVVDKPTVDMATCTPRINEVLTSTSTSAYDEFVEIYNPCHAALAKFTIVYRAADNTGSVAAANDTKVLYTFTASPTATTSYLVYGGADLPKTAELAPLDSDGIADDGAVGLRDGNGALVDSVGFGAVSAQSAFVRGKAAPGTTRTAAPGQSVSRVADGVDTGNNAHDFAAVSATPGASND